MLKSVRTIVLLLLTFSFSSCEDRPGKKEYLEITEIPSASQNERLNKFSSFPVEKQIDVYLFAMCCVEPSDTVFEEYLILNGKNKIEKIVGRLDKTKDLRDKTNLIRALASINKNCKCLSNNSYVLDILSRNESKIDEINNDNDKLWKELYSSYLNEIKANMQIVK